MSKSPGTAGVESPTGTSSSRLVRACLDGNIDRLCALVDAVPRDDPSYTLYVGVHAAAVALLDSSPPEGIYHKIRRLVERPDADIELRLLLLFNAALLAVGVRRHDEARRLFRLSRHIGVSSASPDLRAALMMAEAGLRESMADYAGAAQLCGVALGEPIVSPSFFWARLKGRRAGYATLAHALTTAASDLEDLGSHPQWQSAMNVPIPVLRARWCCEAGKSEEGLGYIDEAEGDTGGMGRGAFIRLNVELLIRAERPDEAAIVLEQAVTEPGTLSTPVALGLRATLALFANDLSAARHHGRAAIVGVDRGLPVDFEMALRTLSEVELASGHAPKARRILHRLDPGMTRMPLQMHWTRLAMLEGDAAKAGEHFQRVHAMGPAYLAQALRTASEVPAYRLAQLMASMDPVPSTARPKGDMAADAAAPPGIGLTLVGRSPCMQRVRRQICDYAPLAAPVLISGETGTGKEVVARLLHEQGPRATGAFVPVNCGALSDTLIESELFGHARGAFTGADHDHDGLFVAAGDGTILLDEIHGMSARMQATLLRVLENGEVRPVGSSQVRQTTARVVAATNESLEQLIEAGRFRRDLYYRLVRLQITLEPLRRRGDDLVPLMAHWLRDVHGNYDVVASEGLIAAMREDLWPGNVRQLYNEIDRMLLAAGEARILTAEMFRATNRDGGPADPTLPSRLAPPALGVTPPIATGHRRNAHDRRLRLRQLIDQRDRLTRADVVALLGCSPNTATRDLQALTEEGYIRRVQTSAHLRTSYFVRIDRAD